MSRFSRKSESRLNVSNIFNENENGGSAVSGISTFSSPHYFVPPSGTTAERPSNPGEGMIRFNTDSGHLEYYRGDHWADIITNNNEVGVSTFAAGISAGGTGTRGLFAGGYLTPTGNCTDKVDYITVDTLGNATNFGDLVDARNGGGNCADRTRALHAGGRGPTTPGGSDTANITFTTIASTGNYADSGFDLSAAVGARGVSNNTRGLFGTFHMPYQDTIDYVTIQHLGTAQDFGNLTEVRGYGMAVSSPVRAVFAGGINNPTNLGVNTMDYVTISSTGNALDFGDLVSGSLAYSGGNVHNSTRGIIGAGTGLNQKMDFITIATTGNATFFGSLSVLTNSNKGSCSSPTRGIFAGGYDPSTPSIDHIEYVTIAATGTAVDFGDLTQAKRMTQSGCSNGHGGL